MTFTYERIADDLRDKISSGRLAEGDRLPSEHELAAQYATTRTTVRKAVAVLRWEGRLVSEQGRGVFVRPRRDRYADLLVQLIDDDELMLQWGLIGAGDVRSPESRRMLAERKRADLHQLLIVVRER